VRQACAPAPATTAIASRSPPTRPPVGFRMDTTAAGSSSPTGAMTWSGSVERHPLSTVVAPRRWNRRASAPSRPIRSGGEQKVAAEPGDDTVRPGAVPAVGEDARAARAPGARPPRVESGRGRGGGGGVDFVDRGGGGGGPPGPALAGVFLAPGEVDRVVGRAARPGAEGGRGFPPAALDEQQLER